MTGASSKLQGPLAGDEFYEEEGSPASSAPEAALTFSERLLNRVLMTVVVIYLIALTLVIVGAGLRILWSFATWAGAF